MNFISLKRTKQQKMQLLKKELLKKIEDKEYELKIENLLKRVDYQKSKFTKDGFEYYNKEKNYKMNIKLTDNEIYFKEEDFNNNKINIGQYKIEPSNKYYIKYQTETKTIYENIFEGKTNKDYDSYNITTETAFQSFNENKIEMWYLEETKQDNYFLNKKTKEKIFPNEQSYFENYKEKNYYFRDKSGYIIKKLIREYSNKQNNAEYEDESYYLISKNHNPKDYKLPRWGLFVGIPKELYSEYKLGKCDFDKVYKSRVRGKITTTYY